MGDGELELLWLATALTDREFGGIVLIDNLGSGMAPEWQGRVLHTLQQMIPFAQIIIATHAGPIWDRALDYERTFLASVGDPCRSA